jgi:hypothetical protein
MIHSGTCFGTEELEEPVRDEDLLDTATGRYLKTDYQFQVHAFPAVPNYRHRSDHIVPWFRNHSPFDLQLEIPI